MDVQGHRGTRGHLPENTLPAFERALEIGVDTLEMDCGITKDGVVVIHHDRRLNPDFARGPDGKWVSAPAPTIFELTFQQLQQYDVGRLRPGSEYAKRFPLQKPIDGTRIPRLSALFDFTRKTNVRFNIETKLLPAHADETVGPEQFARALYGEIRQAGMAKRAVIQSFDYRTLKIVEREAPEIETVYLTELMDAIPAKVHAAGAKIWSPDMKAITPQVMAEAKKLGLRVVVWTANEPAEIAAMIKAGVDGIISDYPDRVMDALKRKK
ncbi:MAG: glycerophosphoryl diester phosphodiesterase [Betaproteobacteria bacterium]|jgi:glycerophosphoryl diester phosphodiesterase|nr:glycerophosphoryl diester phosphodiesterase [Betaproteobacteria bacterium]